MNRSNLYKAGALAFAVATATLVVGCTAVASFEQKAAPVVAQACSVFHSAEANPIVQVGLTVGATAATAASGVPVGAVVASVKSFGDNFCAAGPSAGDTSTPAQQAAWLSDVTAKLIAAASGK